MNLVAINLGTLLSSHTISAVLFGVFTVQTYVYAQNFAPLNAWTKSVVRVSFPSLMSEHGLTDIQFCSWPLSGETRCL